MMQFRTVRGARIESSGFVWVVCWNRSYWVSKDGRWVDLHKENEKAITNTFVGIRSVRAFRRRLRQWREYLPPGIRFVLVHRRGDRYNVIGTT